MKNQMDWIVSGVFLVFAIIGVVIWMQTKPIPEQAAKAVTSNASAGLTAPSVNVVYATSLPGGGGNQPTGGRGGKGGSGGAGAKFGGALGGGGGRGGGPKRGGGGAAAGGAAASD